MPADEGTGVILEAAGRELECPRCRTLAVEGDALCETCDFCHGPLVFRKVISYRFSCPECGCEGFAPANHGNKVRCGRCRGEFDVQGMREPATQQQLSMGI